MYAWLFYLLPGPRWFKWIIVLTMAAVIVVVLMEVVFPWFDQFGFFSDSTIELEE